ncbi:MAG: hypothetical protein ABUL69_00500 [Peristeroidobacter soli]
MIRPMLFTCIALAGCASPLPPDAKTVDANGEVTLAPGERVFLDKTVPVRFLSVVEDSRCPQDATCIWAGQVTILIDGVEGHMRPTDLREGSSISVDQYQVTLVRVEPQPVSTAKIARENYRATLRVAH